MLVVTEINYYYNNRNIRKVDSVLIKTMKKWNVDETFGNGILLFWVDGNIFPKRMLTATLNREVIMLKEKLENIPINENPRPTAMLGRNG